MGSRSQRNLRDGSCVTLNLVLSKKIRSSWKVLGKGNDLTNILK